MSSGSAKRLRKHLQSEEQTARIDNLIRIMQAKKITSAQITKDVAEKIEM